MSNVLGPDAPRLWTIPPGENFLGTLAQVLADGARLSEQPDALADALIYVPNRRSARALALALYRAGGGKPIITPEIRALGDLETDEPPTGTEEAIAGLGPPLSPGRRLGTLARLVTEFYHKRGLPLPPRSALAAARELARLLDQAALSGHVDWSILPGLVAEADLADHWKQSTTFLEIITDIWPKWLDDHKASEPFARRLAVAEAIAESWRARPPGSAIIIAGSTGATPASRALMDAALTLPLGRVVLPGLDQTARADTWTLVARTPDHPQHALATTLAALRHAPSDIAVWPGTGAGSGARHKLILESLAPAASTANWLDRLEDLATGTDPASFATEALEGLSLVTAADEGEEALLAALMLRESLEREGVRSALITPDANLARRVAAHLRRWGIDAPPSAGTALLRTPAGQFIALVARWALDPGDPVALAALLKHPFSGTAPELMAALEVDTLRGPRRWQDLGGLAAKASGGGADKMRGLAATLAANAPHLVRGEPASGPVLAEEIAALAQSLATEPSLPWRGPDGAGAMGLMELLGEVAEALPDFTPEDLVETLEALATGLSVPMSDEHDRIAIWGPLEARLQTADRIILAGLNEGVWPSQPSPDGFLPRRFRPELGLAPPEARLGLSAHDFAQLATAPDVTLLLSERREDAPAVASRWVWRLRTLVEGALGREGAAAALAPSEERDPQPWLRTLEDTPPDADDPHRQPRPTPPPEARPKRLSVTRIGTLQRDPYAIYAEQVLKLEELSPMDAPIDARVRGTAIHAALERFERENGTDPDQLCDYLNTALKDAGEPEEDVRSGKASRAATVRWYLDWRAGRQADLEQLHLEKKGTLKLDIGQGFTLSAQADRIDRHLDGSLSIIDFKTGDPPSEKEIRAGLDQQMPLQALIAERGGFEGVRAAPVRDMIYVAFKTSHATRTVGEGKGKLEPLTSAELTEAAEAGLTELLSAFADPATPYLSAPRVKFRKYPSAYERLARRAEWAGDVSDE